VRSSAPQLKQNESQRRRKVMNNDEKKLMRRAFLQGVLYGISAVFAGVIVAFLIALLHPSITINM
jgi:cell division septal protein FtsQ